MRNSQYTDPPSVDQHNDNSLRIGAKLFVAVCVVLTAVLGFFIAGSISLLVRGGAGAIDNVLMATVLADRFWAILVGTLLGAVPGMILGAFISLSFVRRNRRRSRSQPRRESRLT